MEGENIKLDLLQLFRKCLSILLTAFLFSLTSAFTIVAQSGDENFESSAPILISEADSTKALTANPDSWKGALPTKNSEIFQPGSRVVVFVTNIDLLPDEGANAFRAFAEDTKGKQFRLKVENIGRLRQQNWIYG